MPRPSPRWAHGFRLGTRVDPLPAATAAAIRDLFDLGAGEGGAFLSALAWVAAMYRDARRQYRGPEREPSPAEIRAAAAELKRRADALAELLDTPELGGALDYLATPPGQSRGLYLHRLRGDVRALADAAAAAARDVGALRPNDDPRRDFARDVARAMRRYADTRPTAYFSTEYGKRGAYAALLGLLFVAVDGAEPGDLRKLVQAGARATR